jgi:hypothetical protein
MKTIRASHRGVEKNVCFDRMNTTASEIKEKIGSAFDLPAFSFFVLNSQSEHVELTLDIPTDEVIYVFQYDISSPENSSDSCDEYIEVKDHSSPLFRDIDLVCDITCII